MKVQAFILLPFCLFSSAMLAADSSRPTKTIVLPSREPDPKDCDGGWKPVDFELQAWIDEAHLAGIRSYYCSTAAPNLRNRDELILVGTDGSVRSSSTQFPFQARPGPAHTLLVSRARGIDLMDLELRTVQALPCPAGNAYCGITVAPPDSPGSDFALCFAAAGKEICDFYLGLPAELARTETWATSADSANLDPYLRASPSGQGNRQFAMNRGAWNVGKSETWFYNDESVLMRRDSTGSISAVSEEKWTPKFSDCTGGLSSREPSRFFAFCSGAHVYTDGELDTLFGYSRIAVFDVETRRMLLRIDGPAYTTALISPSGQQVAVAHGKKIRLYRVN